MSKEKDMKKMNYLKQVSSYEKMGYTVQNNTMSYGEAVKKSLLVLPLCILLYVGYLIVAGFDISVYLVSVKEYCIFVICVLLASGIVHEFLHGLTWAIGCKQRFKSIHYGINWKTLTPWCGCDEPLNYVLYTMGMLMPTIVLGVIPYIISIVTLSHALTAFAILNIAGGSADILMTWVLRKCKGSVMLDSPYGVGCTSMRKIEQEIGEVRA